jgi:hypothetical protein
MVMTGQWLLVAVPLLRWLIAVFQPLRLGFNPKSGRVRFVVDRVAVE